MQEFFFTFYRGTMTKSPSVKGPFRALSAFKMAALATSAASTEENSEKEQG
jgi:hypothetical protein